MKYRKFGLVFLLAALAAALGCGIEDERFGAEGTATVESSPSVEPTTEPTVTSEPIYSVGSGEFVAIRVEISHLPKTNEPFTVTGTFVAKERLDDVEVSVNSRGGVYLDGEDRWNGALNKGDEVTLTATFAVVREGNHTAGASAYTLIGGEEREEWIAFNSDATSGRPGFTDIDECCSPVFGAADPPAVSAPSAAIIDTAIAVNLLSQARVELIAAETDLARLRSEGLLPDEMRHQWKRLEFNVTHNQHLYFYVAYFGPMRPTPGCFVERSEDDFLPWNDGDLQISLTTRCVAADVPRADKPTSPVTVLQFARRDHLYGPPDDPPAYEGNEFSIELIVDGESAGQVTVDLRGELTE